MEALCYLLITIALATLPTTIAQFSTIFPGIFETTELSSVMDVRTFPYGNQIFSYYIERRTFTEAMQICANANSNLLVINSEDVMNAVVTHLRVNIGRIPTGRWEDAFAPGYWVGGNDIIQEGNWRWLDGSNIPRSGQTGYQNWFSYGRTSEPNGVRPDHDCLYISARDSILPRFPDVLGRWFDGSCQLRKYFICQGTVDPCTASSCLNNGVCQPSSAGGFTCVCAPGFTGVNCENVPPTRGVTQAPITVPAPRPLCCQIISGNREACGPPGGSEANCNHQRGCCFDPFRQECYLPLDSFTCNQLSAPRPTIITTTPTVPVRTFSARRGWLQWSGWIECSATCGQGVWYRFRGCYDATPGSAACPGVGRESTSCQERECEVEVVPTWGNWGPYSDCSASCNGGTRTRTRSCVNGSVGDCEGSNSQSVACFPQPCPTWGPWSPYEDCPVTCGGGFQTRTRSCQGGTVGQVGCDSFDGAVMSRDCAARDCEFWTEWSRYDDCTASCGSATRSRTRICVNGNAGSLGCPGSASEIVTCTTSPCPGWTEWSDFGRCTRTCGGGTQSRTRICQNGFAGVDCEGDSNNVITCNPSPCETWSDWSSYGRCSESCGTGQQTRTRQCVGGSPGDAGCPGSPIEATSCNTPVCPYWAAWGEFKDCSVTCGEGVQERVRVCMPEGTPNSLCGGAVSETIICNTEVPCDYYGQWSFFGDCTSTCGAGSQRRRRQCIGGFAGSGGCFGLSEDTVSCDRGPCPSWGPWGAVSDCSVTCGFGSTIRTRVCQNGEPNDCPGDDTLLEGCNPRECEFWQPWELWTGCSATCGFGIERRSRVCQFGVPGDNGCQGPESEVRNCQLSDCPAWRDWSSYSPCTLTCGGGSQVRNRICVNGSPGDEGCEGLAVESTVCFDVPCPTWSEWSDYGTCDAPCNGGNQIRRRTCLFGNVNDDGCRGPQTSSRICNSRACSTWTSWSDFSDCDATCSGGTTFRSRNCVVLPNADPIENACIGEAVERFDCNTALCSSWGQWGDYSSCSNSCGSGIRTRRRTCLGGTAGQGGCIGALSETITCQTQACPSWGEWSLYTACSATCEGGVQTRERECRNGVQGDIGCDGVSLEESSCNERPCPSWQGWSSWSNCPVSCGGGNQARNRGCENGNVGQAGCIGTTDDTRACNSEECPYESEWSTWGGCSATCGSGTRSRTRTCVNGAFGVIGCSGPSIENRDCGALPSCASWTQWVVVGDCSVTCGSGSQQRLRICDGGLAGAEGCEGASQDAVSCVANVCPVWRDWSLWTSCSASCDGGVTRRSRVCIDGDSSAVLCEGNAEESRICETISCDFVNPPDGIRENCTLLDVAIIIDSSSSIGADNFEIVRDFLRRVISRLNVGLDATRISALRYNRDVIPLWTFLDSTSTRDLLFRIGNIIYNGEGTLTGQALEHASITTFSEGEGNRPDVPDLAIVLTDGRAQDNPEVTVELLKAQGVRVIAIAVTNRIDEDQINAIASDPDSMNALFIDEFGALLSIVDDIALFACGQASWTDWSSWGDCSGTCGTQNIRTRRRECVGGFGRNINNCEGASSETEVCNTNRCPTWSEWSTYSDCTTSCGTGSQMRTRTCLFGSIGQIGCIGAVEETRNCNAQECSSWGDWSSWSVCSATCGVGVRSQVRKCVNGTVGDKGCQGSPGQLETCESENGPCKSWSTWKQWSDCTATCSGGLKIRSRTCFNGSSGDVGCTGNETDSLACNEQPCTYWAQWSENKLCSVTCGGGFVVRERSCVNGDTGELGCEGSAQEPSECNTQECPGWSYWSTWTECSLSCGSGKRTHSRQCIDGEVGNVGCEGNDFEEQDCNTKNCSSWGDWSSWTSCSVSCDDGILSRSRQCINGSIGDGGCLGNSVENSTCNTKPCPQFSSWGLYSPCSATCNGGIQSRNRTCLHDNSDGTGCQGSTSEIIPCGTKPCLECFPNQQEIGFQFGSVACSNETKVGSICIFTCQPGYLIVGSSELECLEKNSTTALWDGEPPDCQAKCTDLVDVVFVIDSSSSIRSNNFKIIQRFLVSLVQQFRIGMNASKFGAIRYNRHVDHLWNLKDNPTTEDVINAIENIPYDGSGTLTGKALNYTRENLFLPETGRRRGVAKVVVVITDGKSFDDIVTPSQLLKQDNTFIVVLGIGRVDSNQISQIASEPKLDFATIVEDFSSLNQNLNKVASQIRLCQGNQNITLCPSSTVMDVLFIVDGSSSIGTKNFEIVKNFVISLIEVFKVGNDTTQIGYIRYNAVVDERFQFGEYNNTEDVLEAVRRVPYRGQGTRTGQAITYAANNALSATAGRRPGVPAIAIVITDGRSQDSVFSGAQLLRNKAKVIAVGVKGAAIQDLDMIATDPDIQNVFIVNDFDSLLGQVDSISSTACYLSRNA